MKKQPNQPILGMLDDPELVNVVRHIKFTDDQSKTDLHRYLALKIYKMHGELDWRDQEKYWSFLSKLDAEELPKTQRLCDLMMEKLAKPDERAKETEMLIRQPLQLEKGALKVKKSRWKKQLLNSKHYSLHDLNLLVNYYVEMDMISEPNSIFNLQLEQVYGELIRLKDKLSVSGKSLNVKIY